MTRSLQTATVAALVVTLAQAGRAETLPGSAGASEALALCMAAEQAPATEQSPLLERGLALAEAAVAADSEDAKAHFAVFCNLGRELRLRPRGLGSLRAVGRLKRAIDRTLELVPESVDALTGKGMLLFELPRFLGGDRAEAERVLHRALDLDPACGPAQVALARVLAARGSRAAAVAQARHALEGGVQTADVQALLASLED